MLIQYCKKIVSFFATIVYLLKRVPQAVRGRRFLRQADSDDYYIINPCNIGDIVVSTVAARAIQKDKHIVVMIRSTYRSLHGELGGVDCLVDDKHLRETEWYIRLTKRYEGKNYIYGHFRHDKTGLIFQRDTSISVWEDYCKNVFHIPVDTLHNCYCPAKQLSEDKPDALSADEIVLCPNAKSMQPLSDAFWVGLSQELQTVGFKVYTNVAGTELVIEGTLPLRCGLKQMCSVLENSGGCISLRSGICDLLAVYSTTNLFIINRSGFVSDMPREDCAENWDISFLRDQGVFNFMYNESEEQQLINEIVRCVMNQKEKHG